jgi:hypothetical protein
MCKAIITHLALLALSVQHHYYRRAIEEDVTLTKPQKMNRVNQKKGGGRKK